MINREKYNYLICEIAEYKTSLKVQCEYAPCQDGLVTALHAVGHGFMARLGHTKDYHKNSTNCLPTWHAGVEIRVW